MPALNLKQNSNQSGYEAISRHAIPANLGSNGYEEAYILGCYTVLIPGHKQCSDKYAATIFRSLKFRYNLMKVTKPIIP
jgi:hypothetical protein